MQVTQQTRAPCQCALRRTIRPLQASCSAGVARSLVIRAVAHDEQRPVRAEGAHPAEPEQICSPSPIAACAPALTLLPLLATPLAHAGGFPSIADLFSLDGVTAVLFATVFAALLTVTLGVAYLSLKQWLDSRQEQEDREAASRVIKQIGGRPEKKDEDSDDEDDEPGGFITKRKAKAGKREKKGFASEF